MTEDDVMKNLKKMFELSSNLHLENIEEPEVDSFSFFIASECLIQSIKIMKTLCDKNDLDPVNFHYKALGVAFEVLGLDRAEKAQKNEESI